MEIDTHILSLTMEFERQNIVITEWETERAKNARDKKLRKKTRKVKSKKVAQNKEDNMSRDEHSPENIHPSTRNVPTIVIDSEVIR